METPFTQQHEILSRNTRYISLSYGENPKSLSRLVLERYRVVTPEQTDRQTNRQMNKQTDRITIANMRYS